MSDSIMDGMIAKNDDIGKRILDNIGVTVNLDMVLLDYIHRYNIAHKSRKMSVHHMPRPMMRKALLDAILGKYQA